MLEGIAGGVGLPLPMVPLPLLGLLGAAYNHQ